MAWICYISMVWAGCTTFWNSAFYNFPQEFVVITILSPFWASKTLDIFKNCIFRCILSEGAMSHCKTQHIFITLKVLWHSLQASPSPGKQILTVDWLLLLSLWQSTWQQQLQGGKIYFGWGFHHDKKHRDNQACSAEPNVKEMWESNLLHCIRSGSRETRTGNMASLEALTATSEWPTCESQSYILSFNDYT